MDNVQRKYEKQSKSTHCSPYNSLEDNVVENKLFKSLTLKKFIKYFAYYKIIRQKGNIVKNCQGTLIYMLLLARKNKPEINLIKPKRNLASLRSYIIFEKIVLKES